jgi:uncharacterized membrane protein
MDLSPLIASLEASAVATAIRNSLYLFPLIESVHVLGLTLVFGTIVIVDLRLLGVASTRRPFSVVAADGLKWTWVAFAITATTGALMFVTNASTYYHNAFFRTKMTLLVLSGLNVLLFDATARRSIVSWDEQPRAPRAGRVAATVSLVLWIGVIFMGRWVGFTTASEPGSNEPGVNLDQLEDLIPR